MTKKGIGGGFAEGLKKSILGVNDWPEKNIKKLTDGVGKNANSIYEKFDEQTDVLSGQKIINEMREALELQGRYNDILASKLEEALNRISALEVVLKNMES